VAVPACVIEKLGVGKSLSRSSALTRGYRWPIFGIILLTIVGSAVVSYLVTRILGMIGGAIAVILFGAEADLNYKFGHGLGIDDVLVTRHPGMPAFVDVLAAS